MLPYVGYLRPMLEICYAICVHKHRPRRHFWLFPSLPTENTPSPCWAGTRLSGVSFKSGRRPRARVLAGGLRLVTEGYMRPRPLPPTLLLSRVYTPGRPPAESGRQIFYVIYILSTSMIAQDVENIVFTVFRGLRRT